MPFPETLKTKRGTDLGGSKVRTKKWEMKKARELLTHVKCELLRRHESRDVEKVVGCSNLGLRGGRPRDVTM